MNAPTTHACLHYLLDRYHFETPSRTRTAFPDPHLGGWKRKDCPLARVARTSPSRQSILEHKQPDLCVGRSIPSRRPSRRTPWSRILDPPPREEPLLYSCPCTYPQTRSLPGYCAHMAKKSVSSRGPARHEEEISILSPHFSPIKSFYLRLSRAVKHFVSIFGYLWLVSPRLGFPQQRRAKNSGWSSPPTTRWLRTAQTDGKQCGWSCIQRDKRSAVYASTSLALLLCFASPTACESSVPRNNLWLVSLYRVVKDGGAI